MKHPLRQVLSSGMLLLVPVLVAVAVLVMRDSVPDPLPRHWGADGEVDGTWAFGPFSGVVLGAVLLLGVIGVVAVWFADDGVMASFVAPWLGWTIWFVGVLFVGTLMASLDAASAEDVGVPWLAVVAALALSSCSAWVLHRLHPPGFGGRPVVLPDSGGLDLKPDERVAWLGTARSGPFGWLGGAVLLVGIAALLLQGFVGLALLSAGVAVIWMHVLSVRIDEVGVHVGWGPLRWPGGTTPLDRISGVEVTEILPLEWGGWGYRLAPHGVAYVVRRGPGLVLHRRGRKSLAITVDRAEEAGAVLEALRVRAAHSSTTTSDGADEV